MSENKPFEKSHKVLSETIGTLDYLTNSVEQLRRGNFILRGSGGEALAAIEMLGYFDDLGEEGRPLPIICKTEDQLLHNFAGALTSLLNQNQDDLPNVIDTLLLQGCNDVYNSLPKSSQDELDLLGEDQDRSYAYIFNLIRLWKEHQDQKEANKPTFPLKWETCYTAQESPDERRPYFIGHSAMQTGTSGFALWVIDEALDHGEEGQYWTIRRSSALLLEHWTAGTSQLFSSIEEAIAECQRIEDMIVGGQRLPEF